VSGPRFVPLVQRVRALSRGQTVLSSTETLLALEPGHLPVYYVPSVLVDLGTGAAGTDRRGAVTRFPLPGAPRAAYRVDVPAPGWEPVAGHYALRFTALDAWYEEDEPVRVHPRDPYHRVDVLRTSRRVVVPGLASSTRPALLLETGLPERWYLPRADVDWPALRPHPTVTGCPYKGVAEYWSTVDDPDRPVAWSYPDPVAECPRIAGLVAFFGERVDIEVDGVRQERPRSPWS
jgi:uncharacterized protein (DUF427 family)